MKLFGALALALCLAPLAGCGDDSAVIVDMTVIQDMSAAAGTENCLQIIVCAQACSGATQVTCAQACAAKGTTKAQGQYNALIACAYGQCTVANDGGAAACTSTSDTSSGCATCLTAGAQTNACASTLAACGS